MNRIAVTLEDRQAIAFIERRSDNSAICARTRLAMRFGDQQDAAVMADCTLDRSQGELLGCPSSAESRHYFYASFGGIEIQD